MKGFNKVMLLGNLGRDPEVQYTKGNVAMAKFTLATTETYTDKTGTTTSQTEWHTIIAWRNLADIAQKLLHKGSLVFVEGKLKTRTWEDKDKIRRSSTEIVADNIVLLDKRRDAGEAQPEPAALPDMNFEQDHHMDENAHKDTPPY